MKHFLLLAGTLVLLAGSCKKTVDYDPNDIPAWAGLAALPADSGYQLHIEPFPIPAQFEREIFIRRDLHNSEEIFVNRIQSKCRSGTHHFVLSTLYSDGNFPLPEPDLMYDQNNFDGTFNLLSNVNRDFILYEAQSSEYTLSLPPGYGLRMPADMKILCNSHYFNRTDNTRYGEVYCNLYTLPRNQVQQIVENGVLGNESFSLPPNATTTITTEELFTRRTQIVLMTPHYHKRGQEFKVQIVGGPRDGEIILTSYDYQHPEVGYFINTPLILDAGQGLRTIVTYRNETANTVSYGVTSEDEMNYLFYYYFNL
jgi:hypothetical protein